GPAGGRGLQRGRLSRPRRRLYERGNDRQAGLCPRAPVARMGRRGRGMKADYGLTMGLIIMSGERFAIARALLSGESSLAALAVAANIDEPTAEAHINRFRSAGAVVRLSDSGGYRLTKGGRLAMEDATRPLEPFVP